jgi:cytochrome c oxidase subunit 2
LGAAVVAVVVPLGLAACEGPFPQSTLHPTSDFSGAIDDLYRTIFWFAVGVFVVVQGLLFYVVVRYRARPGGEARHIHGSTALEIAWTLAPAVVLVFIAVPTMQTIFEVDGRPSTDALEVEVVGHQWWWEFKYPQLGITTANELHVPVGRPVSLTMTSADVIHSFWVPRLGGKRDAMPGRTTRLAFTADSAAAFSGQCAEFCGESHANMRFLVMVDESAAFDVWAVRQRASPSPVDALEGLVRQGAEAFREVRDPANHSCVACHAIDGMSFGVLGPNLTHIATRTTIAGGILRNTSDGLTRWLRAPSGEKPGSLMPDIVLTEAEITALVAYLQSLN